MSMCSRPMTYQAESFASIIDGKRTAIVCKGKQVSLRFFDRLKDRDDFKDIGSDQKAMKLPARAGKRDTAAALVNLACGIEDDPQDRGADKCSAAEVDDDKSDAIVCRNAKTFLHFVGNVKIDVLLRPEKKNAVRVV